MSIKGTDLQLGFIQQEEEIQIKTSIWKILSYKALILVLISV